MSQFFMPIFKIKPLLAALAALQLAAPLAAFASSEVNLYSARKEALIKPLLQDFTKSTGIKVNLLTGKADGLLKRLELEGEASPADLFITTDAGRLHRAKQSGVLQSIDSDVLEKAVPTHLQDKDNQWFALSQRARPIFYVKGKVNPAELSSYESLADPKWKNKVCIRSSNNIYNQSLVASMLEHNGAEATQQWADEFVKTFAKPPAGGDRDQLRAAAAGQCDIAIANTYYFAAMANGKKEKDRKVTQKLGVFWPNQDNRGTHMNISGAGVTKHAKNKQNAIKLLEFLTSNESQKWYAEVNHEYPVVKGVSMSQTLKELGQFKGDTLLLNVLGENNRDAVKTMDRAGWK